MRACQVPRMPHLLRFFSMTSTPSMSGVQMRAVTPSAALPVLGFTMDCLHMTVNMPERAPEVDHFFSPFRMKYLPSSLSSQRVSWPPASQPTLGSEREKADRVSFA